MRRLWRALLRKLFGLLYNELAWTYDLVAWLVSLGQWKAWARTATPYLRGERVLELAHGPGHLLVAIAEDGCSPVGLDLSPHMGRLAQKNLRRTGIAAPLVRARAQAIPFRDGSFDSAVTTFPTEFILAPPTLRETARVLRSPARAPEPRSIVRQIDPTESTEKISQSGPARDLRRCSSHGPLGGRLVVVAWARLDERDLLTRSIGWLYRVTGQGEPLPGESHLALAGRWFALSVVWEQVGLTQVMLVVAEKR